MKKRELFLNFIDIFYGYIDENEQNIGKSASDDIKALKRRHSNSNDNSKKKKVEEGKTLNLLS